MKMLNPEEQSNYGYFPDTEMISCCHKRTTWSMIPNEIFQIMLQYVSISDIDKKFKLICSEWTHNCHMMFRNYNSNKLNFVATETMTSEELKILLSRGSKELKHIKIL